MDLIRLYLNLMQMRSSFVALLEVSPVSSFQKKYHGYPHTHFSLQFLPSEPQTPVSTIAKTLSEVMAMAWPILETLALRLLSSVANYKEDMT